jgi:nicotinate-nucleotide pyrophosphorylase (carboxylating)
MDIPAWELEDIIRRALAEDIGSGDVTTDSLIPPDATGTGAVQVRQGGIIAGLEVLLATFRMVDPAIQVKLFKRDGDTVEPGDLVARLEGPARGLLKGERVALNFIQRMSAIATATNALVRAVEGLPVRIIDTRKTTPGLRPLERYSVRAGGGRNHRYGLSDGVLIKDNHLEVLAQEGYGIPEAIRRAREAIPHTVGIEIEVENLEQAREAAEAGADAILLDNMSPAEMGDAVQLIKSINEHILTEASGGVTIENIRGVAQSGVDLISSGALTHSVKAMDIGIDFELANRAVAGTVRA